MPKQWDESADVVVVGSGGAALTAAYTAAAGGARTLVLEKTRFFGGTSAYSGSCLWLPGNPVLRRHGVDDSVARGLEYFQAVVGDRTPAELQEAFVSTAPELVEFLERDPALEFEYLPFPDYFPAPGRCPGGRGICPRPLPARELGARLAQLRPPIAADQYAVPVDRDTLGGGQALIGRLLLALHGTGTTDLRLDTPLRSLVVEGGRVTGVVAGHNGGEPTRIRAERGVIVAAGGFENNPELRRRHHGLPGADWTSAPPNANTGDALAALTEAGAAVDLLDEAWWCPSLLFPNGRAAFTVGVAGGIFVDARGARFANESLPYDRMGHAVRAAFPDLAALTIWWIFDGRFPTAPALIQPPPNPGEFRAAGLWHTADTFSELAERIGVPALADTVARFNGFAATGVDADFHRGEDPYDRFFVPRSAGANPCLVPIERPPFHAVRIVLGDLGTKGGARIGVDGQVLDPAGARIPGLFAAGNSAASVAGTVYPGPGVPLGSGMVFGYRAARRLLS